MRYNLPVLYSELCRLESFKEGVRHETIELCEQFLNQNNLQANRKSIEIDKLLWERIQKDQDSLEELLCLRCRVSHPIQDQVRFLFSKYRSNIELREELNLHQMMICVLDDQGEHFIRVPTDQGEAITSYITKKFNWKNLSLMPKNQIKPFGAEVIYSFNPLLSNIDTWTSHLVKSNALLKSYFVNCGLLLQSPWSLIADSSPTRVREAWNRCKLNAMTSTEVVKLHCSYLINYKKAKRVYKKKTGKITGWKPDKDFLSKLQPPQTDLKNLHLINKAIRRYLNPMVIEITEQNEYRKNVYSYVTDNELSNKQSEILQNVLDRTTHVFLSESVRKDRKKWEDDSNRELAWKLYSEGLGQREIAKRCDHKQGWVSKLIQEKFLAESIAQEAAIELIKFDEFKCLRKDPAALDRTTQVLTNFLISTEQEGELSLLKKTLKEVLDT